MAVMILVVVLVFVLRGFGWLQDVLGILRGSWSLWMNQGGSVGVLVVVIGALEGHVVVLW